MAENAALIGYDGGWAERTDDAAIVANGRIEGFLALGAVTELGEAYRLADQHLGEFSTAREQTDLGIEPATDADTPYVGYHGVADFVTVNGDSHEVLSMSVTETENGRAVFVATLNDDVVLSPMERVMQWLSQLAPGSRGGRSKIAQAIVFEKPPRGRVAGFAALSETFTKADSAGWDADLDWSTSSNGTASAATASNRAVNSGTGAIGGTTGRAEVDLPGLNQYVEVDVPTFNLDLTPPLDYPDLSLSLIARMTDGSVLSNGVRLDWYSSGVGLPGSVVWTYTWRLYDGASSITSDPTASLINPGDTIRMTISGVGAAVTVKGYINGVEDFTYTGALASLGRRAGLAFGEGNNTGAFNDIAVDNWSAGVL